MQDLRNEMKMHLVGRWAIDHVEEEVSPSTSFGLVATVFWEEASLVPKAFRVQARRPGILCPMAGFMWKFKMAASKVNNVDTLFFWPI